MRTIDAFPSQSAGVHRHPLVQLFRCVVGKPPSRGGKGSVCGTPVSSQTRQSGPPAQGPWGAVSSPLTSPASRLSPIVNPEERKKYLKHKLIFVSNR